MKAIIFFSVFAVAFATECGENQHDEPCGTACPLTCENYQDPPKFCVLMCNPGCHCDDGYVRRKDGRCVEPEQCTAQAGCRENARYRQCGTACPLTCENYKNPPKFCPAMCVSGCHCKRGFVKNSDGQCVKPENCPDKSPPAAEVCNLPAETGMCRGYSRRFYYEAVSGTCKKFVYGGCGGNENNFASLEECKKKCGSS